MANELAYGFVGQEQLLGKRLTEVGTATVWDMIRESVNEHNRQIDALLGTVAQRTILHQERFRLPGSGTLQPLDEYGVPRPVEPGAYFDVAYPIRGGGTAFGGNRVTNALMTVQEINALTLDAQRRDADWLRRQMLAAIFTNTTVSFDDPEFGSLTIQPLANSDTVKYNKVGGATATDDHYLAQSSSIDDSHNPFDDIYDELMEHPSNGNGPVVVYVPSNLKASVEALTAFTEVGDPDLRYGVNTPQIGAAFGRRFGDEVLGKVNKCWVVEWRALPDSYMIGIAEGAGPILGMREYPAASLQGLFIENHSPDGNLQQTSMIRYAGFGVRNRIGALAYRIGNASYAIPSGYTAPLAV